MRLAMEYRDGHPGWTTLSARVAVVGLAAAAAMALFGLPPLNVHGPLHFIGIMDPLCGATRASRLTVQGDLVGAWTYNPLGIVIVGGAVLALLRAGAGLLTGHWVNLSGVLGRRWAVVLVVVLVTLLVLLQIRQQGRADLLMQHA